MVIGPGGIPTTGEQVTKVFYSALIPNEAGPILACILMTGLLYGRAGFRDLLSRLLKWRVGARWYAVALLTAPLLAMATLLALLPTSPAFLPGIFASGDKAGLLLSGIMVGLFGGLLEEPGWTGFATPELRRRFGVLTSGLILGAVWGAWHFFMTFLFPNGDAPGAFSLPVLLLPLVFYVLVLPVFRVLMVWVYDHTKSLLVAILMHATLIASTLFVVRPLTLPPLPGMTWYLVLAGAMWAMIAAVALVNRRHLARQPLPRGVA